MIPSPFKIHDGYSVESLSIFLHDARFTDDSIQFDSANGNFALKCWIHSVVHQDPLLPNHWKSYSLSLSDVTNCKISQEEAVCFYEISTVQFNKSDRKLDIFTHYAIEINLEISVLKGMLTQINETREKW